MLDKLIEYLKNLPEEEKKKLEEALQAEESTTEEEQTEPVEESTTKEETTEQEDESTEQTQEQTEETTEEQEVQNVEEKQEEQTDNEQVEEEQSVQEQADEPTNQESTEETSTVSEDLLDTKIELALLRAGIREDRIEAAKRLFKTEIKSIEDLEKLKELIKEFPEWQAKKEQGKGFGVAIKEHGTSLTEEEKKLKSMGIDPKN